MVPTLKGPSNRRIQTTGSCGMSGDVAENEGFRVKVVLGARRSTSNPVASSVLAMASTQTRVGQLQLARRPGSVTNNTTFLAVRQTKKAQKSVRYGAMRQAAKMEKIVRRVKLLDILAGHQVRDEPAKPKPEERKEAIEKDDRVEHFREYVGSATRRSDEPEKEDPE